MNRLDRSSINMLTSTAGYVIPMVISFATTPLLLKMLGEEAYGIQCLVGVIVGYLAFMDMGLDLPITKFLAEDIARKDVTAKNYLLSTTFQLYVGIGIIGMTIIILLSEWLATTVFQVPENLSYQAVNVFRLAGIGFLGSVGTSWGIAVMMGLQRFDVNYSVSVVLNTTSTLIGLGVVYAGFGLVGYILVRMLFTIVMGPVYFILMLHLIPDFQFHVGLHKASLRRVIGYVGYGVLNRIMRSLAGNLDKTLIGIWVGVAAAGVYAVPVLVSMSLGMMISYALGFIFPMASELHSLGQMERLRDIFIRASRFNAALSCGVFIPLIVLGDVFMTLWIPSISERAEFVLRLLAMAGLIGSITASLTNCILIGMGGIKYFTIYSAVRCAALTLFLAMFINMFGMNGAGWAMLATCIIDVAYFIVIIRHYLNIPIKKLFLTAYLKPFILGGILGVLAFIVRPLAMSWIGFGSVCIMIILVYVTIGYNIGVFGETEKRAAIGLWRGIKSLFINQAIANKI